MKIGQFSDTFLPVVDGVGRVVSNYARELGELGQDCYVITPRQKGAEKPPGYTVIDYPSLAMPGLTHYQVGIPALSMSYRRKIDAIDLDIVHAHSPFFAGREALRAARRRSIPLVATFHSKYYDDLIQVTRSRRLAKLILKNLIDFYEDCDHVWAVSEGAAEVLQSYGYRGRIEVVKNGTDPVKEDPARIRLVTERYGLTDEAVLLFVGQMNWKKNIRRILDSTEALIREGRKLKLILAGQGPSSQEIRDLTVALGIDPSVILTGHITEPEILQGLYARADLFLFPSLYDTAGLVVSEAAALGTPSLLAAGSDAAREVLDGVNALVAENTTEAMARRMAWALDHPAELAKIGETARRTIPRAWKDIIQEVLERYEQLNRDQRTL